VRTQSVRDGDEQHHYRLRVRDRMKEGDRFQVTLDVAVVRLNNGRARLQFKTDSGTIVRFWYGIESLDLDHTLRNHGPHALNGAPGAPAGP
jgi:hypothetical protein